MQARTHAHPHALRSIQIAHPRSSQIPSQPAATKIHTTAPETVTTEPLWDTCRQTLCMRPVQRRVPIRHRLQPCRRRRRRRRGKRALSLSVCVGCSASMAGGACIGHTHTHSTRLEARGSRRGAYEETVFAWSIDRRRSGPLVPLLHVSCTSLACFRRRRGVSAGGPRVCLVERGWRITRSSCL
jgi:hypothetical protein